MDICSAVQGPSDFFVLVIEILLKRINLDPSSWNVDCCVTHVSCSLDFGPFGLEYTLAGVLIVPFNYELS